MGRNFKIIERESDIHVIKSKPRPYPRKDFKFETSWSWNLTANLCLDVQKNYKIAKDVLKSWNLSKCHDIIWGECEKKLTAIQTSCNARCLQTIGFSKKFQRDAKYPEWFVVEVTYTSRFHCENFLYRQLTTKYMSCEV